MKLIEAVNIHPSFYRKVFSVNDLPVQSAYQINDFADRIRYVRQSDVDKTKCTIGYIVGRSNSNTYFRPVICNKEYCPTCGSDESFAHNRRMDSVHNRLMAMVFDSSNKSKSIGYLVVTIPNELRSLFNRGVLERFKEYWKRKLKRKESVKYSIRAKHYKSGQWMKRNYSIIRPGYKHGLIRYHWCGDDEQTFKPHLNILLPGGFLSKHILDQWRLDAAIWMMREFGLDYLPGQNIYYQYESKREKIRHMARYVTRSTLRKINKENQWLLSELHGFRNCTMFGGKKSFDYSNVPDHLIRGKCDHIDKNDNSKIEYFAFTRSYLEHINTGRGSSVEHNQSSGVIRASNPIVTLDDSKYRLLKSDGLTDLPSNDSDPPIDQRVLKIDQTLWDFMEPEKRVPLYYRIINGTAQIV